MGMSSSTSASAPWSSTAVDGIAAGSIGTITRSASSWFCWPRRRKWTKGARDAVATRTIFWLTPSVRGRPISNSRAPEIVCVPSRSSSNETWKVNRWLFSTGRVTRERARPEIRMRLR